MSFFCIFFGSDVYLVAKLKVWFLASPDIKCISEDEFVM